VHAGKPAAGRTEGGQRSGASVDTAPLTTGAPGAETRLGWAERLEQQLLQEVLTATYWFDSEERGKPYSVSIRFAGRRLGVVGKPQPRDHFVQVETGDGILPGSGPVAITTWVYGVNPGEWVVTAEPVVRRSHGRSRLYARSYARSPSDTRRKPWRRWPWGKDWMSTDSATPLKTSLLALARVPGIYRPAWPLLVGLGVLVGLAI